MMMLGQQSGYTQSDVACSGYGYFDILEISLVIKSEEINGLYIGIFYNVGIFAKFLFQLMYQFPFGIQDTVQVITMS